mmetsp:Transcript_7452/g.14748  ORF Transcript_7452/g.14748 Transcript_7452/m.14748 type:complete len:271 (+) Transcript_7452:61-873(+)
MKAILLSLSALTLTNPSSATLYCPASKDLNLDYGAVSLSDDGGWSIGSGGGRVSSKASFNLLGGMISFTMDVSNVADAVNTNFYTSSPSVANTGSESYCDIQLDPGCMELDIIENNGQCGYATTLHTFPTDGKEGCTACDRWGCMTSGFLPSNKIFDVKAEFSDSGDVIVSINGNTNSNYSPYPSSDSNQVVVKTMESIGAVIESSMWSGWVPPVDGSCPSGEGNGLNNSLLKVTNVKVEGTVVQGPEPSKCAEYFGDEMSNLRGAVLNK